MATWAEAAPSKATESREWERLHQRKSHSAIPSLRLGVRQTAAVDWDGQTPSTTKHNCTPHSGSIDEFSVTLSVR